MTYRIRPSQDDYYLNIAWVVSRQANCLRRSVGALLVVDRRIISTGYDGTPFGVKNCSDGGCASCASDVLSHQVYQRCVGMYAEQNAIGLAARHGVVTNYTTRVLAAWDIRSQQPTSFSDGCPK